MNALPTLAPDRQTSLPLAASQEMMWEFMTALDPERPGGSRLVVVDFRRLCGRLDLGALELAMADVIRRHDTLRLQFDRIGTDPRIRILPELRSPLAYLDLSADDPRQRWTRLEQLVHADRTRAFDPRVAPLWRAALIRFSATEHILAVTFFHMVSDGWACKVFVEDLIHAYEARLRNQPPPPTLDVDFAGVTELQRTALTGHGDRAGHWRDRLPPLPEYQLFPAVTPAADADLSAEVADRFAFPAEVNVRLRGTARLARTTPYIALLAAYQVLLARRSGRRRIVLGTTTLGRDSPLSRLLIAQFTNNVYVPVPVDPDASLLDIVRAAHVETRAAIDNVAAFHSVATAVEPEFRRIRPWPDNHLFDAWFQSAAPASPILEFPGLRVEPVDVTARPVPGAPAPVTVADVPAGSLPVWLKRGSPIVVIDDDRTGGVIIRNRALFGDGLVRGLIADYIAVVEALVADPGQRVADVRLPDGSRFVGEPSG